MAYLFKVRTAEPEKEPLLAKGSEKFLGNGSETNNGTHPLLSSRFFIMQYLDYNNERAVFSTWSVSRGYRRDKVLSLVS